MDISREPSERDLPLLGERSQVASAPSTPRVALLDNAKGALIYCVVLYHVAVVYTGADRPETPVRYASGFLMVLKPVVMPGFCLISGHLSRASLTPKHVRGLYQALATYALFQLLYFGNNAWSYWYNGFEMPLLPLQLFQPPQAAVTWLWVLWKATLPALMQTRWPLPLACAESLFFCRKTTILRASAWKCTSG
jgi:fucose 4-O-acetylase-like acetyltransferase